MKAIIFNSGYGHRMGEITKAIHKSMIELENGESILHRQLRLISTYGIKEFIITVGPFEEQLRETALDFPDCKFIFVRNDIYYRTNYIYSMYLARDFIKDDMLFLHGDLVFSERFVKDFIQSDLPNCAPMNKSCPLPDKDFKGRLIDDKITEISIHIFDENCLSVQPFYKLEKAVASAWVGKVTQYVVDGNTKCYAENALNEILPALHIEPFYYDKYFIAEIDTMEDYRHVTRAIADLEN